MLVIKDKEASGFDFRRIPVGEAKTEQPTVMAERLIYTCGKSYFEKSTVKGVSLHTCILNCRNSVSVQILKEYC